MKRTLALVMVLVLALAMSPAALAADGDVTVTVNQYDVQSINIAWTSLDFVYTYSSAEEGSWNMQSATVTVTNNSNHAVDISGVIDTTEKGSVSGVTASISGGAEDIAVGDNTTLTVTISGKPANSNVAKTLIGKVKVNVSKAT